MTASAHERLHADPDIGPLVATHGVLTIDPARNLFERLVVSILRQQVSMASAAATRKRLFDAVEVTPEGVQATDDQTLRDVGLSRQKTRYVNAAAVAFIQQGYTIESLADRDNEAIRETLTSITGVGEWTADMQLLFSFGREDVFPVGDLGIRKGFDHVVGTGYDREAMEAYAERWAPYRSYASLYLWRATEDISTSVTEVIER